MSKKGSEPKEGGEIDLINLAYAFSGWNVPPETAGGSKPEETYVHPSVLNPTLTKEEYDKIKGWGLDMTGHAEQCVQRYCELTGANPKNFKKVAAPCMDDHQFADIEMQEKRKIVRCGRKSSSEMPLSGQCSTSRHPVDCQPLGQKRNQVDEGL